MLALPTVLLWTSLVAGFEPPRDQAVILEFVAENCPHCRTMEATVRRLRGDGFPVYRIDARQDRAEAERFGIQGTPTYVLLVRDRPVDRIEGAASYDRITRMFREHTANSAAPPPAAPTRIATPSAPPTASPPASTPRPINAPAAQPATPANSGAAASPLASRMPREVAERAALAATARLRVSDEGGTSVATGTVIDIHEDHALILTCGHVFRHAGANGQIKVDLFAPGAGAPLDGRLITFDLLSDVGLVSIRTELPVRPVLLAPSGYSPQPQTEVFSIGCDNGGQPRIERSRLTRRNGYSGPPNLEATGAPVNGRSGGGLFSIDGQLIGVCNAANEPENKGVYAAFETVHWVVTQAGLARIIPANVPTGGVAEAGAAFVPTRAAGSPPPTEPKRESNSQEAIAGQGEEIYLVVREKGADGDQPRYYPLTDVPAEVWERVLARRQPVQQPNKGSPNMGNPNSPAIDPPSALADKDRGTSGVMPGLRSSAVPNRPEAKSPVFRGQQPRGVWPFLN